MGTLATQAYWVRRRGAGALVDERVTDAPGPGRSLVRAVYTGVSAGTERLVGLGLVPASCAAPMACRYMAGSFDLPLKYGYSLVGTGVSGALEGRRVFVMHPHQALAEIEDEHATVLPDELPAARAALIPNLETALNAVWDADVSAGGTERCVVLGAGSVGLLVAYALWRTTGRRAAVVERDPARRALAESLPWVATEDADAGGSFDVAFHTTGAPEGLQAALDRVGFEGRVIELSWYGERSVTLDLGTHFHHGRKRIVASQVAAVAPSRRATHDHAARLREVLALLLEPGLDRLLGEPVPFRAMPELMADVYRGRVAAPLPLIGFDGEGSAR